ncbi:MAG TPA: hypothetical protein VF085_08675 [Solirubrobacterales bacterium]
MRPRPAVLPKIALPLAIAVAAICTGTPAAGAQPTSASASRHVHAPARKKCRVTKAHARRGSRHCNHRPTRKPDLEVGLIGAKPPSEPPGVTRSPTTAPAAAEPAPEKSPGTEEETPPATPEAPQPAEEAPDPSAEPSHFRFFSPTSVWNSPVPAAAPLDPESPATVGALEALVSSEIQAKTGPSINTTESSVPIYTVPAEQPTVPVQLSSEYAAAALRSAWSAVPLPPTAEPARGNDRHLVVWQPSSDRLWEFWEMSHDSDGWHAGWGGAMMSASSNSGAYGTDAWPGSTRFWGASASSLSIAGGLITFEDLEHGSIEHALSMSLPHIRAGVYSAPAQRGDGKSADPLALPEGAHLRLDPTLDLSSLHLPPVTLRLARAAQRYGIFVRDGARTVTFQAQDPTPTDADPYRGPHGFWEGSYPRAILSSFPWSHLQLLQMDLHANPGT